MHIVAGTAGHIDHGKTALVKALTGTDADRLPEEKQRGITIDLGFAELSEGDVQISFVDVPGHERFVKNMLAGASGIDLVVMVVAADEGVMPQTREHFDICRLLKIKSGIIALTKTDLVDEEMLSLARSDAEALVKGSFLERVPVIPVSSRSGDGVNELRRALVDAARMLPPTTDDQITRLPVDRSFSVKGFGAVVTGTLASGKIADGDELELLPECKKVRVRGIQSHGRDVGEASAGRRTAVNLAGVDHHSIQRGTLIAEPGVLRAASMFDVEAEVLSDAPKPLKTRQRIRLHIGTAEILARVAVLAEAGEIAPGERGFVQLRLETPAAAVMGERFIIRSYSPQATIAGGAVIRPATIKPRRKELSKYAEFQGRLLAAFGDRAETARLLVEDAGERGVNVESVRSRTGWRADIAVDAMNSLTADGAVVGAGGSYITTPSFSTLKNKVVAALKKHHESERLSRGMPIDLLREGVFRFVPAEIQKAVTAALHEARVIEAHKEMISLAAHTTSLSEPEARCLRKLKETYLAAGLDVPKTDEALEEAAKAGLSKSTVQKLLRTLLDSGELKQVTSEFCFSSATIGELVDKLHRFADKTSDRLIDVAKFKEIASVSRKYAIPLLEFFDREKVTVRRGDRRYIL